jgi:hypothetical protein
MFARISSRFATASFRPIHKFAGSTGSRVSRRLFSSNNDKSDGGQLSEWRAFCVLIAIPFTLHAYMKYVPSIDDDEHKAKQKIAHDEWQKDKDIKNKIKAEFVCKDTDDMQTKIDIRSIKSDITQFIKLKNKTEQICIYVISRRPKYIKYIENPSAAVCMMALKSSPYLIGEIKNPTSDMCMFALQQNPRVLDYMEKKWLTNDIIMKAVELDVTNIQYVTNPTKELCWSMIRRDPYSIRYIQKDCVTKEMQLEALKLGAKNISHHTDIC